MSSNEWNHNLGNGKGLAGVLVVAAAAMSVSLVACAGHGAQAQAATQVVGSWESANRLRAVTFAPDNTGSDVAYWYGHPSKNAFTYSVTSTGTVVMDYGMAKSLAKVKGETITIDGAQLRRVSVIVTPTPIPTAKPEPAATWDL